MTGLRPLATLLLSTLAGCGGGGDGAGADGAPSRTGRLGSLRDLVLVDRSDVAARDALFVDRFEVTQGDWYQFARTDAGRAVGAEGVRISNDPSLPAAGMTLRQARAFARWRFARLPRVEEWQHVAVGDGRSRFPWGSKQDPTKANTGDLALGQTTRVGTFESGRRAGGDSPYDLVGNVREWTESVATSWWQDDVDVPSSFSRAHARALATPALAAWSGPGGALPLGVIAGIADRDVPRVVVGSDYETPMVELYDEQRADEWRQRTGMRLYTTAGELLEALLAQTRRITVEERVLVQRFLARERHRAVLLRALAPEEIVRDVPEGSVADWLLRALEDRAGG